MLLHSICMEILHFCSAVHFVNSKIIALSSATMSVIENFCGKWFPEWLEWFHVCWSLNSSRCIHNWRAKVMPNEIELQFRRNSVVRSLIPILIRFIPFFDRNSRINTKTSWWENNTFNRRCHAIASDSMKLATLETANWLHNEICNILIRINNIIFGRLRINQPGYLVFTLTIYWFDIWQHLI